MTLKRMDNVLIVVDDLEAVKAFFIELGLKLEGETTVEGPSVGSLIGLKDARNLSSSMSLTFGSPHHREGRPSYQHQRRPSRRSSRSIRASGGGPPDNGESSQDRQVGYTPCGGYRP
jgi:catechol 2,3-dioxygenase-like lactoylglutathione lyase family enzyme